MPNIIETLQQDEMWYGQDGYPHRISEMEQSHRINVLNWLRRRASQLMSQKAWYEYRAMSVLSDELSDQLLDEMSHELDESPEVWLESQPLVQALQCKINEHKTVDGEIVASGPSPQKRVIDPETDVHYRYAHGLGPPEDLARIGITTGVHRYYVGFKERSSVVHPTRDKWDDHRDLELQVQGDDIEHARKNACLLAQYYLADPWVGEIVNVDNPSDNDGKSTSKILAMTGKRKR